MLKDATFSSEITTAIKKKQEELAELKEKDVKEYYNRMFVFIYNQLEDVCAEDENSSV